jgi:hypothetical protein
MLTWKQKQTIFCYIEAKVEIRGKNETRVTWRTQGIGGFDPPGDAQYGLKSRLMHKHKPKRSWP